MERVSQNLEFSQKLCTKSELSLLDRTRGVHKCSVARPLGTSADTAALVPTLIVGDNKTGNCNTDASKYNQKQLNMSTAEDEEDDDDDDDLPDGEDNEDGVDDVEELEEEEEEDEPEVEVAPVQNAPRANVKKKRSKGGCDATVIETESKKVKYVELNAKLNAELVKYKRELKAYNTTTKDLEEKYHKINNELSEMQQKHERFLASRKGRHSNDTDAYSDSSLYSSGTASITGSEYELKRKYTQVFNRKGSFVNMLKCDSPGPQSNEQFAYAYGMAAAAGAAGKPLVDSDKPHGKSRKSANRREVAQVVSSGQLLKRYNKRALNVTLNANKENNAAAANGIDIYKALKKTLNGGQKSNVHLLDPHNIGNGNCNNNNNNNIGHHEVKEMQATIASLQSEQQQFRNIIQQQQSCLHDYHSRCVKAQRIMHAQQIEIDKLNSNNHQMETEISAGIDQLRLKIDMKLRDVSHLPQMMREEQTKYEKASKENTQLGERLRILQAEASQLRLKIDDLGRRKVVTLSRLKAAERDLKIFKNYNTALKHEKRKLNEELQKVKLQYENMQNTSKRSITRQREQSDKQRRDLQKRVFELELKLSRSQNSTTGLIQERDSLIAELQTQLNTLVHNFEVSQKHIRVLRRHIYTLSGSGGSGGSGAGASGVNIMVQGGHNRGLTDPL